MPHDPAASTSWETISRRLQEVLNAGTFSTWFGNAQAIEHDGERLVVGVPNEFTKSWIEGHFGSLLDAAAAENDLVVELRVAVSDAIARVREEEPPDDEVVVAPAVHDARSAPVVTGINPKYTFDVFVIGASNRFAHAAALAVAEAPAQSYNPLFIHGSTGLGKTHLLQAIGHYVLQQHPRLNVRYVTTETVLNEFVDSMRDGRMVHFKQRYRTYDVLLVDDIQFIEGKERLQEEFFHTFNSLYEAGKQIVISSDRPPQELATLESRLRSRFQWGLITDVQPPDLETRIAILRKKVMTEEMRIGDPQVLTFVADRVTTNIRELEGALTRVVAYASLTGRPISPEVAEEVLRDLFPQGVTRPITIEQIQSAVCEIFHVSLADLRGDKRPQSIAYPRHIAMYLSRELTDASLPKIGTKFGGRDHSTVLHGVNKIARIMKEDREAFNVVQELTTRIKQGR
ncbi:MAG: chromosomal replication initiator protein [Gaiellales bacterium]|jgi:chromosomal replication initiator protein|nr:chromosomal replication initiator protein [Gaiellales bacterium]